MKAPDLVKQLQGSLSPTREFDPASWAWRFAAMSVEGREATARRCKAVLRDKFREWQLGWPKAKDGTKAAKKAENEWLRGRGYALERLLYALSVIEGLKPQGSYRPSGQQLDGGLRVGDRRCVMESKWHAEPRPLSEVLTLRGRVSTLLAGTLGVFVSVSGYARDLEDNLKAGHQLNVILLDGDDLTDALTDARSLRSLIDERIDDASFRGRLYKSPDKAVLPPRSGKRAKTSAELGEPWARSR